MGFELTPADKAAIAAEDFLETIERHGVVTMIPVCGDVVTWETTPEYSEARNELVKALAEYKTATPKDGEGK